MISDGRRRVWNTLKGPFNFVALILKKKIQENSFLYIDNAFSAVFLFFLNGIDAYVIEPDYASVA